MTKTHLIKNLDLLIILIISILSICFVNLTSGIPRLVLGTVYILIVPGYAFTLAIFHGKYPMNLIERIVLSFALSIALVSLIGLTLNFTPFGIRLLPITASTLILIIITIGITLLRRQKLT